MQEETSQKPGAARARPGEAGRRVLVGLASLAIVVAYGVAASSNGFVFDDVQTILQRDAPVSLAEVGASFHEAYLPGLPYYRPIVGATLQLQKALSGDRPAPYHWFNAVLAGLVFLVCFGLLRRPPLSARPGVAAWAAAIFALHPVTSSCVYPITGREALLASLLALLSLFCFLRPGWGWTVGALVSFVLALLCREHVIVLPLLYVLADLMDRDRLRRRLRERVVFYTATVLILVGYLGVRAAVFAEQAQLHLTVFDRPFRPLISVVYASQTVLAPFWELRYQPPLGVWLSVPRLLLVAAVLLGAGGLAVRHRSRLGAPALFGVAWFVVTLAPTSNVILQETEYSERFLVLSLFGAVAAVAVAASRIPFPPATRRALAAGGLVILVAAAVTSLHRASYFRDQMTFTRQWVASDPASAWGQMGLGLSLAREGSYDEAVEHLTEAVRLHPGYAQAHGNLGHVLFETGRLPDAVAHYRSALSIDPTLVDVWKRLGDALRMESSIDEAVAAYRRALEIDPRHGETRTALGNTLLGLGRANEALVEFQEAARYDPASAEASYNVGATLLALGRKRESIPWLQRAIELRPSYAGAHANLGVALSAEGRSDEALGHFEESVRLRPDDVRMRLNLALALERGSRTEEAIERYREVLSLEPGRPEALAALERLSPGSSLAAPR